MNAEAYSPESEVAPSVIDVNVPSASTAEPPNDKAAPQAQAKKEESQPERQPVSEKLDDTLADLGGAVAVMEELISGTYIGITPSERVFKLKKLRELLHNSYREIDDAIALNKELDEERSQLDEIAQKLHYRNFDVMCAAHGYTKAKDQSSKESAPVSTLPTEGKSQSRAQLEAKPWRPYDYLLKEEFTATDDVDLDAGYHSGKRICPLSNWVKAFRARQNDNRMPTEDDCRAATEEEMTQQRLRYEEKVRAKKGRGAKKT